MGHVPKGQSGKEKSLVAPVLIYFHGRLFKPCTGQLHVVGVFCNGWQNTESSFSWMPLDNDHLFASVSRHAYRKKER